MKRRDVLGWMACAVAPVSRAAAQSRRLPLVGFVLGSAPTAAMAGADPAIPFVRAFIHGLRDLGWVEGSSVTLVRRSAEGVPQRADGIFADLVASGADVIAIGGETWLLEAARNAVKSIPIVASLRDDPVAAGQIDNLGKPSGNITGVTEASGPEFDAKRIQLLVELAPGITRIAHLASRRKWEQSRDAPRPAGVATIPATLEIASELDEALRIVLREKADALLVAGDGPTYFGTRRIVDFAAQHGLPAMFAHRDAVEAGGTMAYGSNTASRYREMARLVDRFLRGAKPGEVPAVRPTSFELFVNAKTAKQLGLTIPPSILALADEIVE